jgi:hypoxanthine phosphoribosyltransferase
MTTAGRAPEVVLDAAAIAAQVHRLGREIAADHPDGVVLVGVLKGALIFLSDLSRAIPDIRVELDFMSISRFAPDSGRVRLLYDLVSDIGGRDVVLVEDIVDTGLTLAYLLGQLRDREPRRLSTCAMLDRPSRRIVPQSVDYCGLTLDAEYVLGYGLHVRDLYRNLPYVVAGDRDTLLTRPDAYVAELYRRGNSASEPGGSVTNDRSEEP